MTDEASNKPAETSGEITDSPEETTATKPTKSLLRLWIERLFPVVVVLLIAAFLIVPKVPRTQSVRLHLGKGSSQIKQLNTKVGKDGQWDRQSQWNYPQGAPPNITWTFEVPNGPYALEVELNAQHRSTSASVHIDLDGSDKRIELQEKVSSID